MRVEMALDRHRHGDRHRLGRALREGAVDGIEQLRLAQHPGQVAAGQRPLEQRLSRRIGAADPLMAVQQQQRIGQARQDPLGLRRLPDQRPLPLPPCRQSGGQPRAEAAGKDGRPNRRRGSLRTCRQALRLLGEGRHLAQMAAQEEPEPQQEQEARQHRWQRLQAGEGDEAREGDQHRRTEEAQRGKQVSDRRARRHRRPVHGRRRI